MSNVQTPSKAKEDGADPAVVDSLTLAISSFNHFDKDGNGSLAQVLFLRVCLGFVEKESLQLLLGVMRRHSILLMYSFLCHFDAI